MSSTTIPIVSTLAALAELTANLVRAESVSEIERILQRSVKWMLPVDHVSVVLDAAATIPEIAAVMTTRSARTLAAEASALDRELAAAMVLPLVDGHDVAALVLGVRAAPVIAKLDRGTCHLLAHNVVSALRMVRLLERERAARDVAEVAIRTRDQMIQAVTHDLRNPLGVVMALFELATEDPTGPMSLEDSEAISTSLRRMKGMIDELLDVSKGQSGQLSVRRAPCDLVPLVREAVTSARAASPHHRVELDSPADLLGAFDEARLARVLGNLLSNAIKYSPRGGSVRVRAARITSGAEIRVVDSGIGIPAADLPFVFERFRRAKNAHGFDGNGIGLASSREVVEAHGGSLEVESIEGHGSTFVVRLPLAG